MQIDNPFDRTNLPHAPPDSSTDEEMVDSKKSDSSHLILNNIFPINNPNDIFKEFFYYSYISKKVLKFTLVSVR